MIPELHKILYGEIDHVPKTQGGIMSPIAGHETKLQTGSLAERIATYLSNEGSAKVSEIARAVGSTPQKTTPVLKRMLADGLIQDIVIDGCPMEYSLHLKL